MIPSHIFASLGCPGKSATIEGVTLEGIADFSDLRLPAGVMNCIRVQPQSFDADGYKIEPTVEFKTEKGVLTEKTCPVTNFIRHQFVKGTDGEGKQL